jgi:hypothetical protein
MNESEAVEYSILTRALLDKDYKKKLEDTAKYQTEMKESGELTPSQLIKYLVMVDVVKTKIFVDNLDKLIDFTIKASELSTLIGESLDGLLELFDPTDELTFLHLYLISHIKPTIDIVRLFLTDKTKAIRLKNGSGLFHMYLVGRLNSPVIIHNINNDIAKLLYEHGDNQIRLLEQYPFNFYLRFQNLDMNFLKTLIDIGETEKEKALNCIINDDDGDIGNILAGYLFSCTGDLCDIYEVLKIIVTETNKKQEIRLYDCTSIVELFVKIFYERKDLPLYHKIIEILE